MAKNIRKIAELMGAEIVGQTPDIGGGPFGAMRHAQIYRERMAAVRDEEEEFRIRIDPGTKQTLAEMAAHVSTAEQSVTPMQVAAQLLKEVVAKYREAS